MTRLEELRRKFRPEPEKEKVVMISVEEAVAPLLKEWKHLTKGELLNMSGGGACCCTGPSSPEIPLCPCALNVKAREILLDEWYRKNPVT